MLKDYILKNGLILGSISIILLLSSYAIGVDFFLNDTWAIIKSILPYILLIFLVIEYKKLVGGYISFKETFTVSLGISVAGAFLSTFFSILLFNFIDPEFAVQLKNVTVEKLVIQLDQLPESNPMHSVMENIIEQTQEEDIYSISNQARALFSNLLFHIIFSLIIAAFIKKEKTIYEQSNHEASTLDKSKNKKGNIYFSLLFAFLTLIIVAILTKSSNQPFINILPAVCAYFVFKFFRNRSFPNNDTDQSKNKKLDENTDVDDSEENNKQ